MGNHIEKKTGEKLIKSEIFEGKPLKYIYKIFVQFKETNDGKPFVDVRYIAGEEEKYKTKTIKETTVTTLDRKYFGYDPFSQLKKKRYRKLR